ncbi:ABC transporter substrate-binding protein [Muricoccus radiodurans]|uniref:ABC transporter substrate-binding protein n=1 Tax=Muricoccus radiodurans TaxID=2231721 RepID=UPI003CE91E1F
MELTLACTVSDRTRPILDGRVTIPGVTLRPEPGEPEAIFRRALQKRDLHVTELSMGSHITTTARGDAPYIGVPVFPSRAFRHSAVYIRTDRGITGPADLAGRVVALPEYQQTAALWVRGMLRDRYGVDTRGIAWRTGGERVAITLPPGHDVRPLEGMTPEEAIASGAADAFVGPRPPPAFLDGTAPVARLWPDTRAEEERYFSATRFFPIMHCVAIRRDVAEAEPWLPAAIFRAFAEARAMALAELSLVNVLRVSLPWIAAEAARQTALMGGDPWPYGFARNRDEIAAMTRYAAEDGLAARVLEPEALFHPETLGLAP